MNRNTDFFLIDEKIVGKREVGLYWIFQDGRWVMDEKNMIMDRLWGYDPYEPSDSPYAFGSMSVMDELEAISYERSMELTGGKA